MSRTPISPGVVLSLDYDDDDDDEVRRTSRRMFQSTSTPFRQQQQPVQQTTPGQASPFSYQPPQGNATPSTSTAGYPSFHPTQSQHPLAGPQFGAGNTATSAGWSASPQAQPYQPQFGYSGPAGYGQPSQGGAGQPQYGQGAGQQNGNGQNGTGGPPKRNYLPGYLSGAMGQSESTPPQPTDTSAWDSPSGGRASISSGSPINRFSQSLFGASTRDAVTPSRSPKAAFRDTRNNDMEDDAPPVASLYEFGGAPAPSAPDTLSSTTTTSITVEPPRRPTLHSTPSQQAATLPTASTTGYSVHVFGFPSAALSLVLDHFLPLGTVLSTTPSPEGGNWVTVTYAEPWAALRASRKNGTVLGGVLMLGVVLVDEATVRSVLVDDPSTSASNSGATPATTATRTATPSGFGKPIPIAHGSAFKPPAQATPRRVGTGVGGAGVAGLFGEKEGAAKVDEGPKGVLGRVADMVFGF